MDGLAMKYARIPEIKEKKPPLRIQRTKSSQPIKTPADRILFLQRTIGNQAVQRLIKSGTLQAKLRIGQPGDKYEQEADRVADAVMRMPEPGVQRQVDPEEEEETIQTKPLTSQITPLVQVQRQEEPEEEELQAKATSGRISEVNSNLESHILSLRGGVQPLPESARAYFGPRFGRDFGKVRVHTDTRAAESAKAVQAQAYTFGRDIVFEAGQYAPHSEIGRRLLAHELTHTFQQGAAASMPLALAQGRIGQQEAEKGKLPEKPESITPILQRRPETEAEPTQFAPHRTPSKGCRYSITWSKPQKLDCAKQWKKIKGTKPTKPLCGAAIRINLLSVSASGRGCPTKLEGLKVTETVKGNSSCVPKSYVWPPHKPCLIRSGGKLKGCTDTLTLCGYTDALRRSCTEVVTQKVFVGGKLAETHTITFTLKKSGKSCKGTVSRK